MEALKTFYHSPDYAPLIAMRQAASDGDVALIEGYAARRDRAPRARGSKSPPHAN